MIKRRAVIGARDWRTAEVLKKTVERGRAVEASVATDGIRAFRIAFEQVPDLVLLDTALADPSGEVVCRMLRVRQRTARVPIVLISDRASAEDRVHGLKLGADDYIVKPFDADELRLRIKALLRRSVPQPLPRVDRFDGTTLKVDFSGVCVEVDGRPVTLTRREFDLLQYLVEHRGRIVAPRVLQRDVWHGVELQDGTRTVTAHIARLRAKLGPAGAHIETMIGCGYRFTAEGEVSPCPTT